MSSAVYQFALSFSAIENYNVKCEKLETNLIKKNQNEDLLDIVFFNLYTHLLIFYYPENFMCGIMDVLCGNNPVVGGCPVPFRVFSSMPGLWPVDPSTCPAHFMSDKPKMVPDGHCQMSPRRQDYHDLRPLVQRVSQFEPL